jgi:hypothetical protein
MMARAHAPLEEHYKLFKKAFKVATKLDGLTVIDLEGTEAMRYVHFGAEDPAFAKHLHTWGEAGTVTLKTKSTPKIGDRGIACMMVDYYAPDHEGDVYEIWDPTMNRVHTTRDVIWFCRMFYEQTQHSGPKLAITPPTTSTSRMAPTSDQGRVPDNKNPLYH